MEARVPIDASSIARFAESPFAEWCDAHASPLLRDPPDAFLQLLFEQGREHESRVIAQRHPDARALAYDTPEDGFLQVLAAMTRGDPAIRGAPLFLDSEGLKGRADLLERRDDAPSVFGSYHYVVTEIKLAKNLKDHHRLQAAFYNRMIGQIQGYTPATVTLINRDNEKSVFAYDEPEILAMIRAVRAIREGHKPDAVFGEGIWPWRSLTDSVAREARDVSMVSGVGGARRSLLAAAGFARVDDLAGASLGALATLKGVGEKSALRLKTNAEALVRGRHIRTGRVSFPIVDTEIFVDLEGTSAQALEDGIVEMDYLIGVLVRRGGREEYKAFVARSRDDEASMWREFLSWLSSQSNFVLYHWHHYEKTHFEKLAKRHGIAPDLRALLFDHLRDLFKDATSSFAFPVSRTSIKAIAPYAGFSWRHKDVSAMGSIALYFEFLAGGVGSEEKLQKVLDYNEDDCIAMRVVKDWLVANESA